MKCSVFTSTEDTKCKDIRLPKMEIEGVVNWFDPRTGEIEVSAPGGVNYSFKIISRRALNKCIKQKLSSGHKIKFKI